MNVKLRKIEVESAIADALEAQAAARGLSVSELIDRMLATEDAWSPDILAEDASRLAHYEMNREGVPWSEVKDWMQSWRTPDELPPPKSQKLHNS
jgi:hypothetical protein